MIADSKYFGTSMKLFSLRFLMIFLLLFSGLCIAGNTRYDKKMLKFLESGWQEIQDLSYENKDGELVSASEAYHLQVKAKLEELQKGLHKIKRSKLSSEQQINYDMFAQKLHDEIADIDFKEYQMPINSEGSFHVNLAFMAQYANLKTEKDFKNYLSKLSQVDDVMQQNIDNMRAGLKEGRTQPKVIIEHYPQFIQKYIVDDVEDSIYFSPLKNKPQFIDEKTFTEFQKQAKDIISQQIQPSYANFKDFMVNVYIPNAREDIAARSLPDGKAYYQQQIKEYTTLELTPEEIHQIGWQEVKRIRAEMEEVIKQVGFKGSFAQFLEFLRTDERFYAKTAEELLKEASYIAKRMDGKLPELFTKLPRQPYTVNPVPASIAPNYTTGRYASAPLDSTRPGQYWVNTYALEKRPLYNLEALTFHEAVPGHHLQSALSKELDFLPDFRRYSYISAYGEGWGLYCEKLAKEVGFYQDPYSEFGRLTYDMWRAMRLVVDTGMHAMGMSRDEAIKLMEENTALSKHNVRTEIDRYIGWPAQALSYKLGEIKIWELRSKAEKELGEKFDIRTFHDAILSQGSVPLNVLEGIVEEFIRENL